MQLSRPTSTAASARCSRARHVSVRAALPDGSSKPTSSPTVVAMLSAAVMASAAFLGSPVGPVVAAEEVAVVEGLFKGYNEPQKKKLEAAEQSFEQSGTLKALLEKSEANKAKNKREIQNKYCYRQAELGIGDCGGLRYIPGMTKSGKQQTPEWLQKVLGVEVPKAEGEGQTLEQLLGPKPE